MRSLRGEGYVDINDRIRDWKMQKNRNTFRSLDAYKKGKELVILVYTLLKSFPKEEQYAICDQLRRAVISITSNIAEGYGRDSIKEKIHFLDISYGSLMEVLSQMDVACELGYISKDDLCNVEKVSFDCSRLIKGLKAYYENCKVC